MRLIPMPTDADAFVILGAQHLLHTAVREAGPRLGLPRNGATQSGIGSAAVSRCCE